MRAELFIAVSIAALTPTDSWRCSEQSTCELCLNITGVNDGHCGWCNANVTYNDHTMGPKCVDIDEPFRCDSLYAADAWACPAG